MNINIKMSTKEFLEKSKKEYLSIKPRKEFIKYGWLDLKNEIERREKEAFALRPFFLFKYSLIGIVILFAILGSTFGVASAASRSTPGSVFYPLKRVGENILSLSPYNSQLKIKNRAQEIEDIAKRGDKNRLQKAVETYREILVETKKKASKDEEKKKLRTTLKEQEQRFEELEKNIPAVSEQLNSAIHTAQEGQKETEPPKNDNSNKEEKLEEKTQEIQEDVFRKTDLLLDNK